MTFAGPLEIGVLGGFELVVDGAPADAPRHRAARHVVARLGLDVGVAVPRARLAATLWPDLPAARGRKHLRQALWHARRALGDDVILGERELRLDDRVVRVDAATFERSLDRAASLPPGEDEALACLEEALDAYGGPFLAADDDEWVIAERERLAARRLDALARATDAQLRAGRTARALGHARAWCEHDPLDEAAHRAAMRACALLDRPQEALHAYRRCAETLSSELGLAPSEATETLRREIERRATVSVEAPAGPDTPTDRTERTDPTERVPADAPDPAPFVGRRTERATVLNELHELATGSGRLLLVEGEPGIGKTRLLRELARDAAWRGIDVVWGAAFEASADAAFAPLADLAGSLLTPLRTERLARRVEPTVLVQLAAWSPAVAAHAPGAAPPPDPAPARALGRALAELARVRPLFAILDDLQWADDATVEALPVLAAAVADAPVALALLYRRDAARRRPTLASTLESIDRWAAPRRLSLGPLPAEEAYELLRRAHRPAAGDADLARRVVERSGGHPLFLLATVDALDEDADEAEVTALPRAVREQVAARLASLDPLDVRLLRAAALADAPVAPTVLAAVTGAGPDAVDRAVARLTARRLLAPHGAEVRVAHDLVRDAIAAALAPAERRDLHAALLAALEAARADRAELLARHAAGAQRWDRALVHHRAAGWEAARLQAFAVAHDHYRAALDAAERTRAPASERFDLALGAETALDAGDRRDEQATFLDRMDELAGSDPARRSDVARRRAWWAHHLGRLDEAETLARRAQEMAVQAGDERREADALYALGTALDDCGRPDEAVVPLERAATLADRCDDPRLGARVQYALGLAASGSDRYERAPAAFERVLGLCRRTGDRVLEARALNSQGALAMEAGRPDDAETAYDAALEAARALGHVEIEAKVTANLGNLAFVRGDVATAIERLERAGRLFERGGDAHKRAHVLANVGSMRGGFLGRLDAAERDLRTALAVHRRLQDPPGQALALDNLGLVARQRGDLAGARALLAEAAGLLRDDGDRWMRSFNLRSRALVELDAGRAERAAALADEGAALAEPAGLRDLAASFRALAARARAEAGADAAEAVLPELERALRDAGDDDVLQGHVLHLWHAQVLERAGRGERAAAAYARARDALERALGPLDAEARGVSVRHVPEHAAIVSGDRRHRPEVLTVLLADAAAPTGRPLRDGERREVAWTVSAPDDLRLPDGPARRRRRIERLASEAAAAGCAPTVADMAGALDVSTATIKRDLARLRRAGRAVRTRGAARRTR